MVTFLKNEGLRSGQRLVLRDADAADGAAGAGDLDCRFHRLLEADALEHRVGATAVGQLLDPHDRLRSALADDSGRSELARERNAVRVAAEEDDLLRIVSSRHPGAVEGREAIGSVLSRRQRGEILRCRRAPHGRSWRQLEEVRDEDSL